MSFRILLIDDVNFFLELEKNYLSNIDCEIYTASNGKEALDKLNEIKPDFILVDYEMPVMNGLEFIKHTRDLNISTVLVSAFIDDSLIKIAESVGVKKILKKPFNKEDLLSIVNDHLKLDKRKRERIKVNIPAFFGFEDKMEKGVLLDISEGGAFLSGDVQLKEEAIMELKFLIPKTNILIKTWAKIVWVNSEKNRKNEKYPAGVGVEFLNLGKDYRAAIKKFIDEAQSASKNL